MISVVIPLYNKEHTVKETLGSVLNQSFSDLEVIIVDDGSKDNGVQVIKDFTDDSRVKIIEQENQGVSVARNTGVENAKYDYIAFLDGDDLWELAYLEKMVEAVVDNPKAGMFCCAGKVSSAGNEVLRIAKKYENKILKINFFENPHVFLHTSATIINKKYFEKAHKFPVGMRRNQDFAFFFSLALITDVVYIGFPLSIYVGDVAGQTTNTPFLQVMSHIVKRYNHVHQSHKLTQKKNKEYLVFLKYELRHFFKGILFNEGNEVFQKMITELDEDILAQFKYFEIEMYKEPKFKYLALKYITITKLRWRLRGYPRVNG